VLPRFVICQGCVWPPTLTAWKYISNPIWKRNWINYPWKPGRAKDELVQDAMAGYFDELARVREMLDRRYDDIDSGRVKPVGGEAFFDKLGQREEALLDKHHAPR
jgi:hypothetical protein